MKDTQAIEARELFTHKKRLAIAVVNFTSITGDVNYRIKGERRCYFSKRENFLKNWRRLYPLPDTGEPHDTRANAGDKQR